MRRGPRADGEHSRRNSSDERRPFERRPRGRGTPLRLPVDEREAGEHERDTEQFAEVDQRVVSSAGETGREGDYNRATADPEVRAHPLAANNRIERSADEEERPERVERDRPQDRVTAERPI